MSKFKPGQRWLTSAERVVVISEVGAREIAYRYVYPGEEIRRVYYRPDCMTAGWRLIEDASDVL